MTSNESILKFFGISDPNIQFIDTNEPKRVKRNGVYCKQYEAVLTYTPTHCDKCGCKNQNYSIIKNGSKFSHILFGDINYEQTILRLKKQRFLCRECNSTFIAQTPLVQPNCQISDIKHKRMLDLLNEEVAMKTIAKQVGLSVSTVVRKLSVLSEKFEKPKGLPSVLCIDEFSQAGRTMNFIMMDGESHKILDIMPGRTNEALREYFNRFDISIRLKVKYVIMDMYGPYFNLFQELFPKAEVVIDLFHVVQHLNRSLNRIRVETMNKFRYRQPSEYRKLKTYWKLILKNKDELTFENPRYSRLFKREITEQEIVDYLLSLDETFATAYRVINEIKLSISLKDPDLFLSDLFESRKYHLRQYVRTTLKSIEKYQEAIALGLITRYTNGPLEGLNNRIKNIKRSGYGYRNFWHLRARIMLVTGSKDYKEQAAA